MILVTVDFVSGYEIETIGLVKGTIVKTKHMFIDILQALKSIIGGELSRYTNMMDEARHEATVRMIKQAKKLHADAIIMVRYTTSNILNGASEIMVYGTAVKLKRLPTHQIFSLPEILIKYCYSINLNGTRTSSIGYHPIKKVSKNG
ncbi:MAG: YbjQ family protein [Holosporaceae bacterium]|jgi:uncharacterized protein YbjQ (UPF0145 family)|nr:YbjQ family protein [Holosporaceae bacterium]